MLVLHYTLSLILKTMKCNHVSFDKFMFLFPWSPFEGIYYFLFFHLAKQLRLGTEEKSHGRHKTEEIKNVQKEEWKTNSNNKKTVGNEETEILSGRHTSYLIYVC